MLQVTEVHIYTSIFTHFQFALFTERFGVISHSKIEIIFAILIFHYFAILLIVLNKKDYLGGTVCWNTI